MKILIIREKHGDTYYNATTDEALYANALYHLENTTMEYIENEGIEKNILKANEALELKDGKLAFKILRSRTDREYEDLSIEIVNDYS